MEFLLASFLAGLLTVLAPCVLSLLPVILGGTLGRKNPWRPVVIAGSLGVSVIVFTLALKATTALIGIPPSFWRWFSGILIMLFALTMVFPEAWEKVITKVGSGKSQKLMSKSAKKEGLWGAALLGASLGPVFTTCSPTYSIILAIVLPANFWVGVLNLVAYSVGLMILLVAIGYGGQAVTKKLRFAANPNGWFKKSLGVLLIVTALMVLTGFDKTIETWIIQQGYLGPIGIEQQILDSVQVEPIEVPE
ncbi:MAG: cytochrome c-type biogenesis protein [Oceanicoccus sp.]|jgi:cytochrome c-type biogenesis protein